MATERKLGCDTGIGRDGGRLRVLVADDEHLVAESIGKNVLKLGYELVGPARNGEEAVELARDRGADIALLDIKMPRMDGMEAANKIYGELSIPVIMVSAFTDPGMVDRCQKIGVFGYLIKPVTVDDLRANISLARSRFNHQQQLHGQVDELSRTLENRKLIEKAKGRLMSVKGLSEEDAMRELRRMARMNRRKLADVAAEMLSTGEKVG